MPGKMRSVLSLISIEVDFAFISFDLSMKRVHVQHWCDDVAINFLPEIAGIVPIFQTMILN